jgi:hypothetical protein
MRKPFPFVDIAVLMLAVIGMVSLLDKLPIHAQNAHGTSSEETPRGTMDGINTSFTINFQPLPFSSLHVYLNGLRLHRGYDYVLGGPYSETVIFALPATAPTINIPQPGDVLLVDYTY